MPKWIKLKSEKYTIERSAIEYHHLGLKLLITIVGGVVALAKKEDQETTRMSYASCHVSNCRVLKALRARNCCHAMQRTSSQLSNTVISSNITDVGG